MAGRARLLFTWHAVRNRRFGLFLHILRSGDPADEMGHFGLGSFFFGAIVSMLYVINIGAYQILKADRNSAGYGQYGRPTNLL